MFLFGVPLLNNGLNHFRPLFGVRLSDESASIGVGGHLSIAKAIEGSVYQ
jgi:hypothetical protein